MRVLIDENLPEDITVWQSENFVHAKSLGSKVSDTEIWNYSRENDLIIVSKDSDFSNRILTSELPPRVIHMRIGNMRFQILNQFLSKHWTEILSLSKSHKLVNVYIDFIEGIK